VYSATGSLRTYTDRALHVGQVLSTDYNMFDCLLTLCELCQDLPSLLRDLWQLLMLMLLPIQADLLQRSMERATLLRQYHQLDVDPDPTELIVRVEDHLSAAVQIIDNLVQPDASGPRVPSSTAPPSLWLCISSISC